PPSRQRESPRLEPGAHVLSLPADRDAGSAARPSRARPAGAVEGTSTVALRDHELDPQGLVIAVIRRLARGTQRVQAALLHAPLGGRELGELENHERARIHFLQGKGQRIPGRLDAELRAAADRGAAGIFEPLALALEDDRIRNGPGL